MMSTPHLLPSASFSTLPFCSTDTNPDLLLFMIDVEVNYISGLIASIAILLVAHDDGVETHRHHIVCLPEKPLEKPDDEAKLLANLMEQLSESVDATGKPMRPVHCAYYDEIAPLLDAIWRHIAVVPEAAVLYDLLTLAGTLYSPDAPAATRLASEVERYCHTITFPSLQHVATGLGYRWEPQLRRMFREGYFDGMTRDGGRFRPGKARSSSKIPIEYYYAAWKALPSKVDEDHDGFARYRKATIHDLGDLLRAKSDAMLHVYRRWNAARTVNVRLRKPLVDLGQIFLINGGQASLANALALFLRAERVTQIAMWKAERQPPAERRFLNGDTLIVTYSDADQEPATQHRNRANREASARSEKWNQDGMTVRLRLSLAGVDCNPSATPHFLLTTKIVPGDRIVVSPLHVVDERLPLNERRSHQPSSAQLLYAARGDFAGVSTETPGGPWIKITMRDCPAQVLGYLFPSSLAHPFEDGDTLSIDPDPNDGFGQQQSAMIRDIQCVLDGSKRGYHTLYHWLSHLSEVGEWDTSQDTGRSATWSVAAKQAQERYFAGLREAQRRGLLAEEYDQEDMSFIGGLGPDQARIVVAHGPPGCGKSLRASHAVFARIQGSLASEDELRVYLSAPTHAATDALLGKVLATQQMLARLLAADPTFGDYFDARLTAVPLFRIAPHSAVPDGITALPAANQKGRRGHPANAEVVLPNHHAIVAGTPGGIYGMFKNDRWLRSRFHTHRHAGLVVLDEAARMSVAEALMASLPLWPGGQLLLCGDHLQFSPIRAVDWENGNSPRVPRGQRVFQSIFDFLRDYPAQVPQVRFVRTHRCNATIANFLREAFYEAEGIPLYSTRTETLPAWEHPNPFVAAALCQDSPLILIIHNEKVSERLNRFEAELMAPILESLASMSEAGTTVSVGIVAAHRAQRALLKAKFSQYGFTIGTVDEMQGGEFDVSILSCTESDADYIVSTEQFIQSPARLNVAVSRARSKAIVIASRAVLSAMGTDISPGLIAFQTLRQKCRAPLWSGILGGETGEVWGN